MQTIKQKFKELAQNKESALIIGTVPGYPDLETSFEIVKKIISSGADILELSSSFSDPIADGPTLTHAHQKVLSSGITKKQIFDFYKKITANFNVPIFVIEYANIIYKIGFDKYFKQINESGIDTLIIPDVPIEELEPFYNAALKNNVDLALLVAPTSSNERIKLIAKKSKIFVYCVLIAGVTGARRLISDNTINFIKRVRRLIKLPLAVGFGISQTQHIEVLSKYNINGFVICSKIIDIINKNLSNKKTMLDELGSYISAMKQAMVSRK